MSKDEENRVEDIREELKERYGKEHGELMYSLLSWYAKRVVEAIEQTKKAVVSLFERVDIEELERIKEETENEDLENILEFEELGGEGCH